MKIDVPFHKSEHDNECGQRALQMVLDYFGEKHSFKELYDLQRALEHGMVWSLGITLASKELGFDVRFFSEENFNEEDELDFYKKYADDKAMLLLKELKDKVLKMGVKLEEGKMSLDELLNFVTKDSVPIALINWYVIAGKEDYFGHFVPITGYDEENVYVHNPGIANAQPYFPIKRDLFKKAWESKGTDKDVTVVFRKKS